MECSLFKGEKLQKNIIDYVQEIRRSAQRACGMVTASQLPSSSNAGSSFMASQAEDDVRMVGDENSRSGGRRGPMDDFLEAGGGAGNGFQGRARNGSGRGRRQQQSDDENEGLWNFEVICFHIFTYLFLE